MANTTRPPVDDGPSRPPGGVPRNFLELTPDAFAEWLARRGEPSFRVQQAFRWIYGERIDTFEAMDDVPRGLRASLAGAFALGAARRAARQESADGKTAKYLLELSDGELVECVLMLDARRTSLCLSSQSGCAMGCTFCATGAGGPGRNLSAGEIIEQAWRMAREARGVTHVVFMGMGEPLRNLEAVAGAMSALTDPLRLGVGARRITLSTCGIASGIDALARAAVHPHLALSLNSPFEEQRRELMPGTRRHPLGRVLEACARYVEATGRQLTFEYVLLPGVNDGRPHARAVADLARRAGARVNVIAYNPIEGAPFRSPESREVDRFRRWLEASGARAGVRYRRGRDILAGCGQLRSARRASRLPAPSRESGRADAAP